MRSAGILGSVLAIVSLSIFAVKAEDRGWRRILLVGIGLAVLGLLLGIGLHLGLLGP